MNHAKQHILLFTLSTCACLSQVQAQSSNLVADGATLNLVSSQFSFTEGPAVNKKGDVYFTDQPNDKIYKYDTKGKLTEYMSPSGRSNGLFFDAKGNLISCADNKNELWKIDNKKQVQVLVKAFEGKLLNGPNDLWIRKDGGIYFTDPHYPRKYWDRSQKPIEPKVYYLNPEGDLRVVMDGFMQPNGIVGNPESNLLYVADIKGQKTYVFHMEENGDLSQRKLFCEMGSDGMTIDKAGNVYLTGKGVTVFNPEGEKIDHIDVPEGWTANVTFGGKKRDMLFITASKSAYTLKMNAKGF